MTLVFIGDGLDSIGLVFDEKMMELVASGVVDDVKFVSFVDDIEDAVKNFCGTDGGGVFGECYLFEGLAGAGGKVECNGHVFFV
jgi:hypothetical protein